jgi:hypothetical protein
MTDPLHLDDDAIETMVRALIEAFLADDARAAALDWLEKRTLTYRAVRSLRLLDGDESASA